MSDNNKRIVFTSKKVDEVAKLLDEGYQLKRSEIPFWESKLGMRREGVTFQMSEEEIEEYIKCKLDVTHFANNYCKVKSEDGTYQIIKLRDYQYDILKMFDSNQFNILLASRQIGKCMEYNTPIFIYEKKTKVLKKMYFFEIIFKYKTKKTIYDYIKHGLYKILSFLDK